MNKNNEKNDSNSRNEATNVDDEKSQNYDNILANINRNGQQSQNSSVLVRPKSSYSARVLLFDDFEKNEECKKSRGFVIPQLIADVKSSQDISDVRSNNTSESTSSCPITTTPSISNRLHRDHNTMYRKSAYKTQHSNSLRSINASVETSNMVRVRNSTLGKSAPSLSASMVINYY